MNKFKEIRPIVLGLAIKDNKLLVSEGFDNVKKHTYKNNQQVNIMKIRSIFTLLILTLLVSYSRAQDIAIKTNLLYGGYTYTPNLSLEIGLGKRSTLDLGGGYNPWNLDGTAENNKKTSPLARRNRISLLAMPTLLRTLSRSARSR